MKRWIFLLILFFQADVWAGPKDSELTLVGRAWVKHLRQISAKPENFDFYNEYVRREKEARLQLKRVPNSPEGLRDLADALHGLGHFAEYALEFDKAIALHEESVKLYMQTNLPTKESYHGPLHAYEHLFNAMVDAGVYWESRRDYAKAEGYFRRSIQFFVDHGLLNYVAPNGFTLPGMDGIYTLLTVEDHAGEIASRYNSDRRSFQEYFRSCQTVLRRYDKIN